MVSAAVMLGPSTAAVPASSTCAVIASGRLGASAHSAASPDDTRATTDTSRNAIPGWRAIIRVP